MLKETSSSIRRYFGIVSFLYLLVAAGAFAQVALLLRKSPSAHVSLLFLIRASFMLAVSLGFGFVTVRFKALIVDAPRIIRGVLHASFWGGIALSAIYYYYGSQPNPIGFVVSLAIYIYLLRSVERISLEEQTAQLPNQLPDPTSLSVTPAAGAAGAPSVAADH